jgi:CAAX protease family protein
MKICNFCGKENEDSWESCTGCGNSLAAPKPPQLVPPPLLEPWQLPPLLPLEKPTRALNAGRATLIFLSYLGAQLLCGVILGIFAVVTSGGGRDFDARLEGIMPTVVVLVLVLGGVVVVIVSKLLVPDYIKDTEPTGAAWVRGPWGSVIKGLLIGIALGGMFALASTLLPHADESETQMGPLSRMAATPGLAQLSWILAALVLAPPVEELLFRGILYAGFRKSFGPAVGTTVTTILFVGLHFTELMYYLPGIFAIGSLALVALWCRLRFRAIGPAIAVHVGYNGMVCLGVVFQTW